MLRKLASLVWRSQPEYARTAAGFTLAELLIALAILGVIATFTIPKILASQQNTQAVAVTREDIATLGAVFVTYSSANAIDQATWSADTLIPYINYSTQLTSGSVDVRPGSTGGFPCGGTATCLKMHNGSVLYWYNTQTFSAGSCPVPGLRIYVDPDGTLNASLVTDGPGKAMYVCLKPNGRIEASGNEPSWFSW